jgi:hypothetical protein
MSCKDMKKEDIIFLILLILSYILGWILLYTTEQVKTNVESEVYNQDSIRKVLDSTYFFNHSQIK